MTEGERHRCKPEALKRAQPVQDNDSEIFELGRLSILEHSSLIQMGPLPIYLSPCGCTDVFVYSIIDGHVGTASSQGYGLG